MLVYEFFLSFFASSICISTSSTFEVCLCFLLYLEFNIKIYSINKHSLWGRRWWWVEQCLFRSGASCVTRACVFVHLYNWHIFEMLLVECHIAWEHFHRNSAPRCDGMTIASNCEIEKLSGKRNGTQYSDVCIRRSDGNMQKKEENIQVNKVNKWKIGARGQTAREKKIQ